MQLISSVILTRIYSSRREQLWSFLLSIHLLAALCRDVNEANKVLGQGRGHIPQSRGRDRGQGQKSEAEAELCEAEVTRDAVLTTNY